MMSFVAHGLQTAFLSVFPALVIVAGLRDLTSFTIPNWISAALIAAFLPAAFACGLPFGAMGQHLGIGLVGLILAMGMFAMGWIGGGDAKLFAAAALWLGWPAAGIFVLVTTTAGGALAMALLAARSDWVRTHTPLSAPGWTLRLIQPKESVPYGVAIAAGALFAFPSSAIVAAARGAF